MYITNIEKKYPQSLWRTIIFVIRCAIWYHLYSLENVKNTHGGVLILVKLQATLLKLTLLHGCFSGFLNCINDTKSRNALHMGFCFVLF